MAGQIVYSSGGDNFLTAQTQKGERRICSYKTLK